MGPFLHRLLDLTGLSAWFGLATPRRPDPDVEQGSSR
jgi:hypothetical protein